ncbi:MAG: B12-binding domain-containing radical SAM protein, partial [Agathobacter sp.]|nr:B12-binding domain-containing radical SAM protein [Agathobacter sp.]
MKILLTAINAKYIHSNLAVYSLKAAAGEYSKQAAIAEFTINNSPDYVLEEIYKQKPDVLMFSCYIWNLTMVEEVLREYHKLCPQVPIWVGGPEVSFEVEEFLAKHPQVKGIMMGEGEATFQELCEYYAQNKEESVLKAIKGIAYRKEDDEIEVNPWREIMSMSDIPFCYNRMEDFSNRIIYYESSRGCPFSCSYCLSSVDKKLRFRDIELVKEELQFFIDKQVPQVKFVDRTFNCHHEHAMAIWQFIKEQDNGVTNFHFEISADLLNEAELELISTMRPGLIQLEIGVQSTNEVTIQEIHRTMKLERLKDIVKRVKSFGNIHQHLDLIAGLPYEDYATFQKSFDEIYELQPNQLQMGFLKVLKGSYMYEHAQEYGILYHDNPPYEVLATKWLSYEDV